MKHKCVKLFSKMRGNKWNTKKENSDNTIRAIILIEYMRISRRKSKHFVHSYRIFHIGLKKFSWKLLTLPTCIPLCERKENPKAICNVGVSIIVYLAVLIYVNSRFPERNRCENRLAVNIVFKALNSLFKINMSERKPKIRKLERIF